MKNFKILFLFSFASLFVTISCNDDDFVQYKSEEFQTVTDGYLQIKTPVIAFQAGIPAYHMEFNVVNGTNRYTAIEVYKVYTDASTGNSSNEVLLETYPVGPGVTTTVTDELTYADLKAGLTVNGSPLPDDEAALAVGSGWIFRFVGKTAEGDKDLNGNIRVGVLSRFAGLYRVIESAYYRIGVLTATWDGQERFIGSVDENTFSYNDWWGNFGWAGNAFHFDLNPDNTIETLTGGGLFGGNRRINCTTDFAIFTSVPCVGSNVLIPDDVNGHHIIKLTYGYFTDGSGPREFYEVLEKI